MSRRILFVDDDPNILAGLQSRLHRQRKKWDMSFVSSGKEALALLGREPFDVIVSDMRMPEMDGATLLKRVQDEHPRVVRIVLSGHAELESALRAVPVAHQFLSKPCEEGVIENVVERACSLQALIDSDLVRKVVGAIDKLPPVPRIYSQLLAALTREDATVQQIAGILKQDVAMCAKLLQIVNSAFFRLSRTISRIEEAVSYLGFNTIKQVVLAAEVFQHSRIGPVSGISLEALQAHAVLVANVVTRIVKDKQKREDAAVAGLLHDIGKLVLATVLPEHLDRVLVEMRTAGCPMHLAEERVLGVTHAEIGSYLLGLWGLPYPIVEAVANHHAPARVDCSDFGILAAVHVADGLVRDAEAGRTTPDQTSSLDLEFLARVGVADQVAGWREIASQLELPGGAGASANHAT